MDTPSEATNIQVSTLLEEYRALYGLVLYRMTALDRRVPVTGTTLVALAASLNLIAPETRVLILWFTPLAVVWFVRATLNHARSFEDVLRRIEEIERAVNSRLGCPLLQFQSRHPSRNRRVGGRTGQETVAAVVATSLTVLLALGYRQHGDSMMGDYELPYIGELLVVALIALREAFRLSQYRYVPESDLSIAD